MSVSSSIAKPFWQSKSLKIGIIIVSIVLLYFPLFLRLDSRPLREWDEARNAVNAYEMSKSGQFLIKTYEGQPDLWETKPPLLEWFQIIGFKTIGYNELAVRLPSALAAMGMLLLFIYWFYKQGHLAVGILAALIVVCSNGFIHEHGARTGDHDALMIAFLMGFLIHVFGFFESKNKQDMWWASLCLSAAVLTKSIAVLMVLPGIFLYLIFNKQLMSTLKSKAFWQAIALFLLIVLSYYISRELLAPGYLQAVYDNEFLPRYLNQSEHYTYTVSAWDFYWNNLREWQFAYWMPLLLPSCLIGLIYYEGVIKRLLLFLCSILILFYVIIAKGSSNVWYDLPMIPMMAIIIGLGFNVLYELVVRHSFKPWLSATINLVLLLSIFYTPYSAIIAKNMDTHETSSQVMYPEALKRFEQACPNVKTIYLFEPLGSNYPLAFYKQVLSDQKGITFHNIHRDDAFLKGQNILVLKDQYADVLNLKLDFTVLIETELYRWMRIN